MIIAIDFDGTIVKEDVGDRFFEHFSGREMWKDNDCYRDGKISAVGLLGVDGGQDQGVVLVGAGPQELLAVLEDGRFTTLDVPIKVLQIPLLLSAFDPQFAHPFVKPANLTFCGTDLAGLAFLSPAEAG